MSLSRDNQLELLPSVGAVLQEIARRGMVDGIPHPVLAEAAREAIRKRREHLTGTACADSREQLLEQIAQEAGLSARRYAGPAYRKAINATGIILHTGLGRAVLPAVALQQITEQLAGYSVLQVDEPTGKRSRRDGRIEWLVQQLTGAESATVVNNNAAATMLVLNTVAAGREVVVSRGQLVEIGGSFRLPEVMSLSGARLVEVGTTNKTHPRDYEAAINENTAAILRVHPSNYRIEGFTAEVPLRTLVEIARRKGVCLIDDVGAGSLIDYRKLGRPEEPTLPDSVAAGADLVLCSTDKMIGGPQGGLILGRKALVETVRKNPMARALRVDKITLSALESTLSLFLDPQVALKQVPTLWMMRRDLQEIAESANLVAAAVQEGSANATAEVIDGWSQVGSGSLPGQDLPTRLVAIQARGFDAEELARRLRLSSPPVFARIARDRVLIDPRTLLPGEQPLLIDVLTDAIGGNAPA